MQLGFLSSFLTGSLLAWEPEFLGPKSSLTYLQLRLVIHPRVQFPISWMTETGLAPEHLFQTEVQHQSVILSDAEDSEVASGEQGAVTVW